MIASSEHVTNGRLLGILQCVSDSTSHAREPEGWPSRWSDASARLQKYREEAEARASRLRLLAQFWNALYLLLGLCATILAAISGVGFLGDLLGANLAGWLALLSAALGAVANFLASANRRDEARRLAADWQDFADRCAASLMDLKGYLERAAATDPSTSVSELVHTQQYYGYEYYSLVIMRQPERRALLSRRPLPTDPEETRRPSPSEAATPEQRLGQ